VFTSSRLDYDMYVHSSNVLCTSTKIESMVQERGGLLMLYRCFRSPTCRRRQPLRLSAPLNRHRCPRPKELWLHQLAQADLAAAMILWPQGTPPRCEHRQNFSSGGDNSLPRACSLEEWPCSPRSPFDGLVQDETTAADCGSFFGHQKLSIAAPKRGIVGAHRAHNISPDQSRT